MGRMQQRSPLLTPRSPQTVAVSHALLNSQTSFKLASAPYPTDLQAFTAFERQSQQPGFVFGFVDSITCEVVTFYDRHLRIT